MDYSLPGSSVYGILQARTLEWVAISFSRGSSRPRDRTQVSHIAGRLYRLSHQESPDVPDPVPNFRTQRQKAMVPEFKELMLVSRVRQTRNDNTAGHR